MRVPGRGHGVIVGTVLPWGSRHLLEPRLAQPPGLSPNPRRCPMTTTTPSTALVPAEPVLTNTERLALAGFLAGYTALTRLPSALALRQSPPSCQQHHPPLFHAP